MADDKQPIAGRPPKDPFKKVNRPIRTLVSPLVEDIVKEDAKRHGISVGREVGVDYARYCIYEHLKREKLITADLQGDPTWDTLKEAGLV